jgi:hypothetical protein
MNIRPKRTDALFVSVIVAVSLLSFLQPACDKSDKPYSPNPGDSLIVLPLVPYNPQPADGAVDVGDEFALSWQCYNPDSSDTLTYRIMLGIDSLYCVVGYNPTTSFTIPWRKQSRAKEMLIQIYEMQRAYHDRYGGYCNNGQVATGGGQFYNLGITIDSIDCYYYIMIAYEITFGCYATANLDDDATIDTWQINQTGALEQTISDFTDDCPIEFRPATTYSWRVLVLSNDHADTTWGPVWHFTTTPGIIPPGYEIGVPGVPMPADYTTGVTCSTVFYWYSFRPDGDSLVYDYYLGSGNTEPALLNRNLPANQTYPNWGKQWKAQQILRRVYEIEQRFYDRNGCYAHDGLHACYGYDGFWRPFGIYIEGNDIYNYSISASCDTFICTAVANIDTDPLIDTWIIDQTGTIRHPIEDSDMPFTSGQSYSWKIVAHDTHGNRYTGPVWHFTTTE